MRKKWDFEKLKTEALKYKTSPEFAKYSSGAYQSAYRMGVLDKICSHMKDRYKSWSLEEIQIEANKYNKIHDFRLGSPRAYHAAHRMGVMEQICAHTSEGYDCWTIESIQKEANKYLIFYEFKHGSPHAYYAAKRRKILNKICKHMKHSRSSSKEERELLHKIKTIYPDAKKFKDMKVNISDKPYIKGFEIDILVGNLGIEFDGKYYHSFEKMRKDKRKTKWSDNDIRNYHKIKDTYFLSKGIRILHIKEEDWLRNKELCINKCLIFLKLLS